MLSFACTFTTTLGGKFYCYSHFKDEETKAQGHTAHKLQTKLQT